MNTGAQLKSSFSDTWKIKKRDKKKMEKTGKKRENAELDHRRHPLPTAEKRKSRRLIHV